MPVRMKRGEHLFNLLLGASVLSWAVLGLFQGGTALDASPTRLSITALHLCVAALVLLRDPIRKVPSHLSILACLPALLISGWAMRIANQGTHWPWYAQTLFVSGSLLAIFTFLTLGKSFSIMPALRKLVTGGPFRFVRHPAYLGELVMILGCTLASTSAYAALPLLAAVPLVALRIVQEERLLSSELRYRKYQQAVPWRLLPRVW
jgi:protein-S-isoprenylcysteine O-methyltransferase Ste14